MTEITFYREMAPLSGQICSDGFEEFFFSLKTRVLIWYFRLYSNISVFSFLADVSIAY